MCVVVANVFNLIKIVLLYGVGDVIHAMYVIVV